MGYGIYLYGIFPEPGPEGLQVKGLDNQPVKVKLWHGFAFLHSEAQQERYLASRRNLLGHEKVLEEAMQHGYRTLLPLQFGLIVDAWETVTQQLILPYGDKLQQLFLKLEGKREVGIKVFWDATAELNQLIEENGELKAKRDSLQGKPLGIEQVISIGQEIEREMQQRQRKIIEVFQKTLNPLAVEVVENERLTEAMIYNASYLIAWDEEEKFAAHLENLDRYFESRLRIRYNNFTAPYNFAQLSYL